MTPGETLNDTLKKNKWNPKETPNETLKKTLNLKKP